MKEVMNRFKSMIPFIMSTTIAVLTEAGVISQEKAPAAQRIVDEALPAMLASTFPDIQDPLEAKIQAQRELIERNTKAKHETKKRKPNEAAVAESFQVPEVPMHIQTACPNCGKVLRKAVLKVHYMSTACKKQARKNQQDSKQSKLGFLKSNLLN